MQKFIIYPFLVLTLCLLFLLLKAPANQTASFNSSQIAESDIQLEDPSLAAAYPEVASAFIDTETLPFPTQTPDPIPSATPTSTPTATPKPTPSPSKAPAKTPQPTIKPSPSPVSSISPQPVPVIKQAPEGSLSGDKIFDLTNEYRRSKNLPEFQKEERTCLLAQSRAPEIMPEVNAGQMHKGLADRKLPYWNNENIAYYNTEEETVRWWVSDYIHRRQIEGNFKYSCVACYKNACAQEFTSFLPK